MLADLGGIIWCWTLNLHIDRDMYSDKSKVRDQIQLKQFTSVMSVGIIRGSYADSTGVSSLSVNDIAP